MAIDFVMSMHENSYDDQGRRRLDEYIERVNKRDAGPVAIPLDDPVACTKMIERWWPEVLGLGERQLRNRLAGVPVEDPEWDPAVLVEQMAASMRG
jgi:hypothetical protein